ncbi:MAG: putative bifunctional diguanylate cyclase/phosphodiesterase [Pseudomonadales bacterium]
MTSLSKPSLAQLLLISREKLFRYVNGHLETLETDEKLALLIIDANGIDGIDRHFGYRFSDNLLLTLQTRLKKALKKAHFLVRLDRTRFALAIPGLKSDRLLPVAAQKIRQLLDEPFTFEEKSTVAQCSIGIAVATDNSRKGHVLLTIAEESAVVAQRSNSPYVIEDRDAVLEDIPYLSAPVLQASMVAGDFSMAYQPKIDLRSGVPASCEALLRWLPEGAEHCVNTERFIAMAEQQRLMPAITEWVVKTTIRESSELSFNNQRLGVALNVSASDIRSSGLQASIIDALSIWGMPPELLTIEVTESAIIDNPDECFRILNKLREHGIRVSIDDFGTGYSSLSYFKKIPADEIKIDQSFIKDLASSAADAEIVAAITGLAHKFNMQVVCEGVEDEASLNVLKSLECDYAQGYYFSKPAALRELKRWLQRTNNT